ncbi:hypothetical protein GCM10007916_14380 [Psychromonas marina]|uniref:DUF3718 domain-containing protein n=1 Tax=Psychromonas marina TaxID=88364 RepID=A0ABQ6DYX4_9GAMM|nr:hypothetical protein [Psychromonas marina]GLS90371.1 hypothetical protein GCM10007916_14380 [Psychromonas marina]
MRKFLILIFISIPSIVFAQDLNLSEGVEVEDALKLHNNLGEVSKLIGSCMDSGNSHLECLCANEEEIQKFNLAVKSTFITYPHWLKARTLNFRLTNESNAVINPKALYAEADKVRECS